ncbi:MAG: radical SAM protein [Firmicutes bacterium]|nr:radical SAM protein [Bacillota bacterium]
MRENFDEVMHTTLNPEGPGAVRIHLIPPKIEEGEVQASVAIINGQDVIPVNVAWAVVLSEFIKQVNKYDGRALSDDDVENILNETCSGVKKVYPLLPKKEIKEDVYLMMNSFTQIARGEAPDQEIGYMNLGDYAPHMRAPHRMDVMVSAMTKNGLWHCNQKCIHCYAAGQVHAEEEELSTEDWKKILDKIRAAGVPQVTFTGGEPTMREDLFELISHARWFISRLNTNGVKLTKEYCQELKNAELDSLQITFYSSDAEVHNKLVGAPQYDNTVSGIKNAIEAGLSLSINTPLCTLNRDYVKTLEFLHGLGVIYVTCSGLITTGNALTEESESLQLNKYDLMKVLSDAVEYCYANGMEINFTSPGWIDQDFFESLGISSPTCGACLSNMAITPGGKVVPCQSWLSGDVLGDMLADEWTDIWESDACRKNREYSAKMEGLCPLRHYAESEEGGEANEE